MNPNRREVTQRLALGTVAVMTGGRGSSTSDAATAQDLATAISVRDSRFGARGNGVTDDTKAIQAAVNTAPVVHIPAGTYIVSDSIMLPAGCRIMGVGTASVLRKRDERVGRVLVNGPDASTGIVIERLTIDGARCGNAYVGGTDGLFLTRCTGAIVREVTVRNCLNDGIIIEYGIGNSVTRCVAQDNAKDGIYSSGGRDITIADNRTAGNLVAGIAVAATAGGLVTRNRSLGNRSDIMLARDSRSIRVTANDCRSPTAFVVSGENLADQLLNSVTYPAKPVHRWDWLYGARSCTLDHNYFGGEVRLILFDDGVVSDNVCAGSQSQGLLLQGANRNRVIGNTISNWGTGFYGIQLASLNAVDGMPTSQGLPIRSTNNIVTANRLSNRTDRNAVIDGGLRNRLNDNPVNVLS